MITDQEAREFLQMRQKKTTRGAADYPCLPEFPSMVKDSFLLFAQNNIDSSLPAIRTLIKMHNWLDVYGSTETKLTHQAIDDVIYFILWYPLPKTYERLKMESPFPW